MNKQEFLKALKTELEKNKVSQVASILADYEEHFEHGLSKGKSEAEISQSLGDPTTIAKAYETDSMIHEMKNSDAGFKLGTALSVLGRLLLLAPMNFFVLFIPGVVIFSLIVTGWCMSLALGSVGLSLLGTLPVLAFLSLNWWAWVASISGCLGLVSMAALAGMVMFLISKYVLIALINYLHWNLKFILNRSQK